MYNTGRRLQTLQRGDRWSDVDSMSFQDCMNVNICEVTSLKEVSIDTMARQIAIFSFTRNSPSAFMHSREKSQLKTKCITFHVCTKHYHTNIHVRCLACE
jgi:hypothetical protein